uniref:C-type lectin domain-containing protein n=1 Tax=Anabas testudineus TaxID=64144 RepID=A0A7N6AMN1_ANATE
MPEGDVLYSDVAFTRTSGNTKEKLCETKPVTTAQPVCPKPTEVKIDDTCPKCEEGWELHGGKCYYFSTRESTWNQSRDYCRCRGGDLVKIDSREEQSFLELRLRTKMEDGDDKFWIGLTDSKEEGKWLWVDDSPLNTSLAFWGNTQPDNWTGNNGENLPEGEDCVLMGKKSGADDLKCWADVFCKSNYKSICEKSAETGRV